MTGENELMTYFPFYQSSPTIKNLAKALAAAQAKIMGAAKVGMNPHFRSRYADLASTWDACREALTEVGIAIVQVPSAEGRKVTITTILMHESGEFISGSLTMSAQQETPQAVGSCITYARRYALASFVGVAPEDDDGQRASTGKVDLKTQLAEAVKKYGTSGDEYTGTTEQQGKVKDVLLRYGIHEELWEEVHTKMMGMNSGYIFKLIEGVLG